MSRAALAVLFCSIAVTGWSQQNSTELVPTVKLDSTATVPSASDAGKAETAGNEQVGDSGSNLFAPLPDELVFGFGGCDDAPSCDATTSSVSSRSAPAAGWFSNVAWPKVACHGAAGCQECEVGCFRGLCDPQCCRRNWIDVDFLLFFSGGYQVPELVAQSAPGTPRPQVGILGDPATSILLGNESLGVDGLFGARLEFGRWLDSCGNNAIVGSLFGFGNESLSTFPSDANTIVSRPFFNVDPNVNALDAELVNYPGIVAGTIDVLSDTNVISGAVGLQRRLCCCTNPEDRCHSRRFDMFFGFRSFSFDENLVITERLQASGGLIPANTTFDVIDRFEAENQFTGFEIGVNGAWQRQRWLFELGGRLSVGGLSQEVTIDGSTTITVPSQPAVGQPYGILAGTSNIGTYERDELGVLSQLNASVGYQLSPRLSVTLGYAFIMLNDVVRPGDLIDLNVNGTHIDPNVPDSGPDHPAFSWVSETLSLHGLTAGFEFTF